VKRKREHCYQIEFTWGDIVGGLTIQKYTVLAAGEIKEWVGPLECLWVTWQRLSLEIYKGQWSVSY